MKVLIDARKLEDGGIGVFTKNIIKGLLQLDSFKADSSNSLTLICSEQTSKKLQSPNVDHASKILTPDFYKTLRENKNRYHIVLDGSKQYSFRENFILPFKLRRLMQDHDILHVPHYNLPLCFNLFGKIDKPVVVTVHDVIHLTHPDTKSHKYIGRLLINAAIKNATKVTTVSNWSKKKILENTPSKSEKIEVIYNALRSNFLNLDSMPSRAKEDYLLYVGPHRKHKGTEDLLSAYLEYFNKTKNPLSLYLIGPSESCLKPVYRDCKGIKIITDCSGSRLISYYKNAHGCIIPSLEEGFSLVALEAMSLGVPILSRKLEVLEEVCQSVNWTVDEINAQNLLWFIDQISNKDEIKDRISQGVKRSKEFNLENFASKYYGLYQNLLKN